MNTNWANKVDRQVAFLEEAVQKLAKAAADLGESHTARIDQLAAEVEALHEALSALEARVDATSAPVAKRPPGRRS